LRDDVRIALREAKGKIERFFLGCGRHDVLESDGEVTIVHATVYATFLAHLLILVGRAAAISGRKRQPLPDRL
jgi:hypothetical protein